MCKSHVVGNVHNNDKKRLLKAKSKVGTYNSSNTIKKIMFILASTYKVGLLPIVMSLYHKWILAKLKTQLLLEYENAACGQNLARIWAKNCMGELHCSGKPNA